MAESNKNDVVCNSSDLTRPFRVYAHGIYDGYNFYLERAKTLYQNTYLLVGCCRDEGTHKFKGKTYMTYMERVESLRNCKWVDEVIPDAPLVVDQEFLKKHKIDLYVDYDSAGVAEEQRQTAVDGAENNNNNDVVCNSSDLSDIIHVDRPRRPMFSGPKRPMCFRVYVHGVYDGHDFLLELAKKSYQNVYLLAGCCNDEDIQKFKGERSTDMTYSERLESLRRCRWVDEVIPDAPLVYDEEFLTKHRIDTSYICDGVDGDYPGDYPGEYSDGENPILLTD